MSQVFRTIPAVIGTGVQGEFGLSTGQLGVFASAFHLAFALVQIPCGLALDLYGTRRTVGVAFVFVIAGALLSALAPRFSILLFGQVLIGVGCGPAFVSALYFCARRFEGQRFAAVSSLVLGFSGLGLLASSIATLVGPPLFGRIEADGRRRRGWITATLLLSALGYAALAWSPGLRIDVALCLSAGLLTGVTILQFADVRDAYPPSTTGRAFGVFNTASFLGVALLQWGSGVAASASVRHGADPYAVMMLGIALALATAATAFVLLPGPTHQPPSDESSGLPAHRRRAWRAGSGSATRARPAAADRGRRSAARASRPGPGARPPAPGR